MADRLVHFYKIFNKCVLLNYNPFKSTAPFIVKILLSMFLVEFAGIYQIMLGKKNVCANYA